MKRIVNHLIIPTIVPITFFVVAAIPVEVMGCRNRGLTAVAIALVGSLAGLGSVAVGLMRRIRGDASANWWLLSTLILVIPAVAIVIIAR